MAPIVSVSSRRARVTVASNHPSHSDLEPDGRVFSPAHGTLATGADRARELLEPLDVHVDYLFGAQGAMVPSVPAWSRFARRVGSEGAVSGDGRLPVPHGDPPSIAMICSGFWQRDAPEKP